MGIVFTEILQTSLPIAPWATRNLSRLPGVNPMPHDQWILRDEAFAPQIAYADHLLDEQRDRVFAWQGDDDAAVELLAEVLAFVRSDPDYTVDAHQAARPDGVTVDLTNDHPLIVARRLVQSDFCVLAPEDGLHVLRGAALCFPASWSLDEKIGRDLASIHIPVDNYSEQMAARVQRMFNMLRPDQGLWRANWLLYQDADLFQPRREEGRREIPKDVPQFVRVERQTLRLLPNSRWVAFGIHTYVVAKNSLSSAQRESLNREIQSETS